MARQISEITRRDLKEALEDLEWWGRLDEIEFLRRLFTLEDLESTDSRYSDAEGDIFQHRVNNSDWPSSWIFTDDRFGLAAGEDEALLRFLTEILHPAVRKTAESEALIEKINPLLAPDGYQIVRNGAVSGRPKYGWRRIEFEPVVREHFTEDIRPLVATVSELAREDGDELEREVLDKARPKLEEPEYDNWDGGTSYYTLTLEVPVPLFAKLGNEVNAVEQRISRRISVLQRSPDKHRITAVVIQPGMVRPNGGASELSRVINQRAQAPIPQFWGPGKFRLFLSHVTSFKQTTAALRQALMRFQISGFVAHDTIEPGELWQREIEAALRSMDAMAAILTPHFHSSRWTDQEVGWALGAGIYVLPVRRGSDPYGFIGEVQGVQGLNKTVGAVAEEMFVALLKQGKTRPRMQEALVAGLERSDSAEDAATTVSLLERAGTLPHALAQRLDTATAREHIARTKTLRERLQVMARTST